MATAAESYPSCPRSGTAPRECQAATAQERWRGATLGALRPGAAAKEGSGQKEQPHTRCQVLRPGGATSLPTSGGCPGAEGLEEPSHDEGQEGQRRRYPSSKVKEQGCALLEQP